MSNQHQLLLARGAAYIGTMTVVGSASGFAGWGSSLSGVGAFGTLSPAIFGKIGGLRRLCSLASTVDLQFWISGTQPQAYFSHLRLMDSTGVIRTYLTSTATYGTNGSETQWSWGTGSSPVFVSGNNNRSIEIY